MPAGPKSTRWFAASEPRNEPVTVAAASKSPVRPRSSLSDSTWVLIARCASSRITSSERFVDVARGKAESLFGLLIGSEKCCGRSIHVISNCGNKLVAPQFDSLVTVPFVHRVLDGKNSIQDRSHSVLLDSLASSNECLIGDVASSFSLFKMGRINAQIVEAVNPDMGIDVRLAGREDCRIGRLSPFATTSRLGRNRICLGALLMPACSDCWAPVSRSRPIQEQYQAEGCKQANDPDGPEELEGISNRLTEVAAGVCFRSTS